MKEKYITGIGEITDDDWKHYLSFTPIEYIQYIQNSLKYNNRFFVDNRFNKLIYQYAYHLSSRLEAQKFLYPKKILHRARVFSEGLDARNPNPPFHGYNADESFVPPESITHIPEGRGNPELIRYLYAASDIDTTIAEVSPKIEDVISVAEIQVDEPICLLQFSKFFAGMEASSLERTKWVQHFILSLSSVFQTPFHTKYDYLICQYICEFAKNIGFDGITFYSSRIQKPLHLEEGINYTIFNYNKCHAISSELYLVSNIEIEHQKAPS